MGGFGIDRYITLHWNQVATVCSFSSNELWWVKFQLPSSSTLPRLYTVCMPELFIWLSAFLPSGGGGAGVLPYLGFTGMCGPSLRSKRFRRVWEQRKTEERGFRYFACAENGARAKNRTVGVGEGEGRNHLRTNPWILKTPVRWRTELVIGWASRTFLTCVDQRSKRRGRHFLFEACLQKALTFLAEWVFSRELWQYGRIL